MGFTSWLRSIVSHGNETPAESADCPEPVALGTVDRSGAIAYAVKLSGLVNEDGASLAFYLSAYADHPEPFLSYGELRKQGDLLDKADLKALGLRGNVKLSEQFLATLNAKGRADPLGAASVIGLAVSHTLCRLMDVARAQSAGIELVKLRASNMLAGPCEAAAKLEGQTIPIADAPMLPFQTCPHPDQCGCRYQSSLEK